MTNNDCSPRLSNRFIEAVKFAFEAHSQQTRTGTENPSSVIPCTPQLLSSTPEATRTL
jgi:hypothetical protein